MIKILHKNIEFYIELKRSFKLYITLKYSFLNVILALKI